MENNEKNLPHEGGEKKAHGRHRPRHRRKPAHPQDKEALTPKQPSSESGSTAGKNDTPRKENNSRNHSRKNRNDRRGGRPHNGRSYETRGPIDPYQEAEDTAAALAELRAMIVVKPADAPESSEIAPSTEPTAVEAPLFEESLPTSAAMEDLPSEPDPAAPLTPAPEQDTPLAPEEKPVEVVGIRFRSAGKIYYFDPKGCVAQKGEFAIVETARGPEFGDVAIANRKVSPKDIVPPLRPVLRIATKEDIERNEENRRREEEAFDICRQKILEHKLDMKLIEAQYAFDNSKLLFYFTSDGRVDFRELVKDLASVFRTRIELRQIGIRDEAKMLGGFGACGRALCCSTFLPDFAQVSIKMAKEQNLSLNSSKISGVCGRLMCCLRYESEVYAMETKLSPPLNSRVRTEDGIGTVSSVSPIAGTVSVIFRNGQDVTHKTYHRDSVTLLDKNDPEELPLSAPAPEEKPAVAEAPQPPRRSNGSRNRGNRGGKRSEDAKKVESKAENSEK